MTPAVGTISGIWNRYRLPFGARGVFNVPIPGSPTLNSNSAAIVSVFNSWGGPAGFAACTYNTSNDFDIPVYQSRPGDPSFTISSNVSTYPLGAQINGTTITIPNAAKASGGSDHHLCVIDQAGDWQYEFWTVTSKPNNGGTLVCQSAGRNRVHGDGLGCGNAIGSKTSAQMGLITPDELRKGFIPHAIAILINATDGTHVWPAAGNVAGSTTNAPPNGSWLQLTTSISTINGLSIPQWQKAILIAAATYGMVVIDTGGASWNLRWLDDATTASFNQGQPVCTFATTSGAAGDWSTGTPPLFGAMSNSLFSGNLQVIDSSYMQTQYENRFFPNKLDPVSTVTNNFSLISGASSNACLSKATYPPFQPTNSPRVQSSTLNQVCQVTVETLSVPSGSTLRALVGWVYGLTNTGAACRIDLSSNGTVIGTYTMASNSTQSWYAIPSTTVVGVVLSAITLTFTVTVEGGGDFVSIWSAHVQAEYAP